MVVNNDLKFAEKVILIDAVSINKVVTDLSNHFSPLIGRVLPKADLSVFLECVAMDAGVKPGEQTIQVLLVYDKVQPRMDAFQPGDLKKELNDVAFRSELGEFQLNTFEPSDMATREDFFLESVKLVADAKEVKRLVVIPSETEYGDNLPEIFEKVDGKESVHVLSMNPPVREGVFQWATLGYAVLQALGIRPDEL